MFNEKPSLWDAMTVLMKRPELYEKGTSEYTWIWTDEHISKGMLEAHLHPDWDAATRPHAYVKEIVRWIGSIAPAGKYSALLDLGCGPGIYAELFHEEGYRVTGVDLSKRSLAYAEAEALKKELPITYCLKDYLALDYVEHFDLITLIYYDFGVLSPQNREKLLRNIHSALKPGGLLVFDVFTPQHTASREENTSWDYAESGGFFSHKPHLNLKSFFLYEEKRTFCERHIIITEQEIHSVNIWQHTFTKDELTNDLSSAGFGIKNIYGNMAGAEYSANGKEMCIVAQKEDCGQQKYFTDIPAL